MDSSRPSFQQPEMEYGAQPLTDDIWFSLVSQAGALPAPDGHVDVSMHLNPSTNTHNINCDQLVGSGEVMMDIDSHFLQAMPAPTSLFGDMPSSTSLQKPELASTSFGIEPAPSNGVFIPVPYISEQTPGSQIMALDDSEIQRRPQNSVSDSNSQLVSPNVLFQAARRPRAYSAQCVSRS